MHIYLNTTQNMVMIINKCIFSKNELWTDSFYSSTVKKQKQKTTASKSKTASIFNNT